MKRITLALLGATLGVMTAGVSGATAASTQVATTIAARDGNGALQLAAVSDTVRVQLAVFGAVIFVVVVVGLVAYAVRKRLGLVAPPPDQPAGGHH